MEKYWRDMIPRTEFARSKDSADDSFEGFACVEEGVVGEPVGCSSRTVLKPEIYEMPSYHLYIEGT